MKASHQETTSRYLLLYFILLPYLYPRGFSETVPLYKTVFTLWLYSAMLLSIFWVFYDLLRRDGRHRPSVYFVALYYILMIVITLFTRLGLGEGIQKMFAAPVLYIFCAVAIRTMPRLFLRGLANVLTLVLFLNVAVFCPPITDRLIDVFHVNFLGHVQISAQYGLLAVFVAWLLRACFPQKRRHAFFLELLALITMIWAGTAAGYICAAVILLGEMVLRVKTLRRFLLLDSRLYLAVYLLANGALFLYSAVGDQHVLGKEITFSGRTFIWQDCMRLIRQSPLFGYGVFGVLIVTFWNSGMNYAHNEFMQRMLDGGAVLCAVFYLMLGLLLGGIKRCGRQKLVAVANLCLIALLIVMLFESVTEYVFSAILFILFAHLPDIAEQLSPEHPTAGELPPKGETL